jgi:diphthamide biosynthesis methyltransferase
MATKRELILEAIKTALTSSATLGATVYRSRVTPLARGESPAVIVEPVRNDVEQNTCLPTLDHSMQVRVAVIVRGDIPDQLADPVIAAAHSAIMADLTLGGIAIDVQPGETEFTMQDADQPVGVIFSIYIVRYRTSVGDLST